MRAPLSIKTRVLNAVRSILTSRIFEPALLKLSAGRELGSLPARALPNHYQYPKPSFRKAERGGIRFDLDISDICDWYVYFGLQEPEGDRLFDLVREGDTVIDVGANIGVMSLNFASRCGPSGRVIGFEPDPVNFDRVTANIKLNKFNNIRIENLALADKPGRLKLFRIDPRNPGMNRFLPPNQQRGEAIEVSVATLDEFIAENPMERIDLIKIDVEGFEMNVLKGARATISRWRPKLYIEVINASLKANGASARQLLSWVAGLNYRIIHASNGLDVRIDEVAETFFEDVIALPEGAPKN